MVLITLKMVGPGQQQGRGVSVERRREPHKGTHGRKQQRSAQAWRRLLYDIDLLVDRLQGDVLYVCVCC
jgi:hypothetical protein